MPLQIELVLFKWHWCVNNINILSMNIKTSIKAEGWITEDIARSSLLAISSLTLRSLFCLGNPNVISSKTLSATKYLLHKNSPQRTLYVSTKTEWKIIIKTVFIGNHLEWIKAKRKTNESRTGKFLHNKTKQRKSNQRYLE